jgi:hypothetical protein
MRSREEAMDRNELNQRASEWLPGSAPADPDKVAAASEEPSAQPSEVLPTEPSDEPTPDSPPQQEAQIGQEAAVESSLEVEPEQQPDEAPPPRPNPSHAAPPEGPDLSRLMAQLTNAEQRIKLAEQRTREAESALRDLTAG